METKIKGVKGFKKDMTCRGFQYKENQTFQEKLKPELCKRGFHFCENPLDVFNYYPPTGEHVYAEVESQGDFVKVDDKVATNKLSIFAKISISKLFKIHFDLILSKVKVSKETQNTSGYEAHANTSGNHAHANTSGYKAYANTSGDYSIACAIGIHSRAKVEKGWIVLTDWRKNEQYEWEIKAMFSKKVGQKIKGVKIEPGVWYWFEGGELKLIAG